MSYKKERDEAAQKYCFEKRKYNPRSAGVVCYLEGFEDALEWANQRAEKKVQGLVGALEYIIENRALSQPFKSVVEEALEDFKKDNK